MLDARIKIETKSFCSLEFQSECISIRVFSPGKKRARGLFTKSTVIYRCLDIAAAPTEAANPTTNYAGNGVILTILGWVKTQGTASANFAVQSLNSSWTPVAFFQVGCAQNSTD